MVDCTNAVIAQNLNAHIASFDTFYPVAQRVSCGDLG